jgi:hypothetical protein
MILLKRKWRRSRQVFTLSRAHVHRFLARDHSAKLVNWWL